MQLVDLPFEILFEIALYLPYRDIISLRSTNTKFYALQNAYFWKNKLHAIGATLQPESFGLTPEKLYRLIQEIIKCYSPYNYKISVKEAEGILARLQRGERFWHLKTAARKGCYCFLLFITKSMSPEIRALYLVSALCELIKHGKLYILTSLLDEIELGSLESTKLLRAASKYASPTDIEFFLQEALKHEVYNGFNRLCLYYEICCVARKKNRQEILDIYYPKYLQLSRSEEIHWLLRR
jgi:F-box domain.